MLKFISFLVLIFSIFTVTAQDPSQLAFQYFQSKEYEKAGILFDKLYRQTNAKFYFEYYVNCLIEQKKFDEAEKLIKKQLKNKNADISFYVDLGYVYKIQGLNEKANEQYNLAIKKLLPNNQQIIALANSFYSKREYEFAEKTYIKGSELVKQPFYFEKANLFAMQRKYPEMINEYLNLLTKDISQVRNIQNMMQYYVINEHEAEFGKVLKTELLRRIQKSAPVVFNEMLVWLFIQENDYSGALIHAKALDKRNNEDGFRIHELGKLAIKNKSYEAAYDAFTYLIQKGKNGIYYIEARIGQVQVNYSRVLNGEIRSKNEINELENNFNITLSEIGKNAGTIELIRNYAHLQAFYMNKFQEAINLLKEAILIRGVSVQEKGECKIELADIYLFSGEVWEATLLYGQAEQENKTNPTGDEAKFKKAKLAFYTGQFKWALAQLDVLKASTSKLIANDAFELAQLIKDNLTEDSVETALKIYANADLMQYQNNDSMALITLDTIITKFSQNPLCDEAIYKKAKIYEKISLYSKAVECYQKIVDNYSFDILGDDAMYYLAEIYETKIGNQAKAMEIYKDFILKYPGSIYIIEARKKFRNLRGN